MDPVAIGNKIKENREKMNLSVSELAKLVGVTSSAISQYESGSRIPRDEIKLKLSTVFKKSVSSIFFKIEGNT